jgi:CrcB protein
MSFLLVGLGGALGTMARFGMGRIIGATALPWTTLSVNVLGGFAMGLLAGWLAFRGTGGESWRLLLGVGVLGGFTTFSAFSLEIMLMLERGSMLTAVFYALASVLLSVGALAMGLALAKAVPA